jgi:hypothetical protein
MCDEKLLCLILSRLMEDRKAQSYMMKGYGND